MEHETLIKIYSDYSYWILLVLFFLWLTQIALTLSDTKFNFILFLKKSKLAIIISALAVTIAFTASKPRYRVLSDETNLLGVSLAMFTKHSALNYTMGKFYYGNFQPLNGEVEKRPLLFPFFISLIHSIRGYDYRNAFVLNGLALLIMFFLIFKIIEFHATALAATSGILLLMSTPVLIHGATSGGFELFSYLFLLLNAVLLYFFLLQPTANRLGLLALSLVLLVQTRYESFIYIPYFIVALACSRKVKWRFILDRIWIYLAIPIFLIPMGVQRILGAHSFEQPANQPVFSLAYFPRWALVFLKTHFDFSFHFPYPTIILNICYLIGLIMFVLFLKKNKQAPLSNYTLSFAVVWGSVLTGFLLYLFFFFGDFQHPASARLFLPWASLWVLVPVMAHIQYPKYFSKGMLLVTSITAFILYQPMTSEARFTNTQNIIREYEIIYDFLEKEAPDHHQLLIYDRPGQLTVAKYGAVDFAWANRHTDEMLNELKRHLYLNIYVFQRIEYQTESGSQNTSLTTKLPLVTLRELQVTATEYLRISKVLIK